MGLSWPEHHNSVTSSLQDPSCLSPASCIRFTVCHISIPSGSDGEESSYNDGDPGLIPESGRSSGEGNDSPLHYSCLENSTNREAWQTTVHGNAKSRTWLSNQHFHFHISIDSHQNATSTRSRPLSWSEKWSEVAQSCLTLCDPVDCSLPRFSVHGIFQARILEWVAISFSRGSSRPRDRTRVSCIVGRCFAVWATREVLHIPISVASSKCLAYSRFLIDVDEAMDG